MKLRFPTDEMLFPVRVSDRKRRAPAGMKTATPGGKPLKPGSKRAKIVEWIDANEPADFRELMAVFSLPTRQHVFSYLQNLRRDNGIGYSLVGDKLTLNYPESPQ